MCVGILVYFTILLILAERGEAAFSKCILTQVYNAEYYSQISQQESNQKNGEIRNSQYAHGEKNFQCYAMNEIGEC